MELKMFVVLVLLLFLGIQESRGCIEEERLALLEFKKLLESDGYDADYLLQSWENDPRSECCEWERVSCNGTTGRVAQLSFENIRQLPHYENDETYAWFFNISMFRHFDELLLLDLSWNSIANWNHQRGSENVLRLKKLETLDLSVNYLKENIIPSLKELSSLKNLNLERNNISHFPLKDLLSLEQLEILNLGSCKLNTLETGEEGFANSTKLSNLKHLDLNRNFISRNSLQYLRKLSSLEYLDLSFNDFSGPFPFHEISGLRNLRVLLMRYSRINGTLSIQNQMTLPKLQVLGLGDNDLSSISSEVEALITLKVLDLTSNTQLNESGILGLCGLKMLEELDLSNVNLTVIPRCLHNLTSLKVLDLSNNAINGEFPSSWIAALTSLKYIDISNNLFQGLFSFSLFNNHSHLESVFIGSQGQSFKVETEDVYWMPKFQLKILVLSNCNLNLLGHKIPSFLHQQHQFRVIDLSSNNLLGRFPNWLLSNNSRMVIFDLSNNSFTGDFTLPLYPITDLVSIDVSKNQLKGTLPRNIGNNFPNLWQLQLSRNAFGGSLPSSVVLMSNLELLDLSFNNFSGEVPETLFQCTTLRVLRLSNNEFTGNFFSSRYNLTRLSVLLLNNNKFTGSLSKINANGLRLGVVDVSFNFMSGRLPTWINQTFLDILNLRHNSLEGEVSCDVFETSGFIDLSENSLSGTLPSCSSMKNVRAVHLQSNNFTGSIPKAFFNTSSLRFGNIISSSLKLLNLRDNRLSGNIPDEIGNSSGLIALLLGENQFSGIIPKNLCWLQGINLMDLSHNYLSGSIPSCLANISFGRTYDQGDLFFYGVIVLGLLKVNWANFIAMNDTFNPSENQYLDEYFGSKQRDAEAFNQVEFVTKYRLSLYHGDILNFMTGIDLSGNNLVGKVPSELGNWSQLHTMNLSHNHLRGPIPNTFGGLSQMESLDLSHNGLTGEIPSQLTQLTFLGVFSVAYNNLSGRIPFGKAQFSTFDSNSYEGNAYLCGKPLDKHCDGDESPLPSMPLLPDYSDEHWYNIDKVTFVASFSASFGVFFSGVVAFLYVNPYWRQYVLYYGEKLVFSSYYFVSYVVFMLSVRFRRG